MNQSVVDVYRDRVARGEFKEDPAQLEAAARLDALAEALESYEPARPSRSLLGRIGLARARNGSEPPGGLYIHGAVGRGKSMLMDVFFRTVRFEPKRRVHFHAFMLEVHDRLHRRRQDDRADEPIGPLAGALASEARLLCFDEFVVQNIADAMILGRLFEALFETGVVVVATSNFAPDQLYENGLNRGRFLPFIALLKQKLEVIELAAATDYRQGRLIGMQVFHHPLDEAAARALDAAFDQLGDGEAAPMELQVGTRRLKVPEAKGGIARFTFDDLCARALGAADYLALTERFHTIVLADVPVLRPDRRNEARRFITLIDALYECRVKLIMSAEAPPAELYPAGEGAFEFQRTVSRLMEMQSQDYLMSARQPLRPDADFSYALTTDLI